MFKEGLFGRAKGTLREGPFLFIHFWKQTVITDLLHV